MRNEVLDSLTLRKADPRDNEFAYGARKAAFWEYVERSEGWEEQEQRRVHQRRFGSQDFRIINLGNIDVGVMAIALTPDCVKVNQLFLLPEYQGRNIGRQCMLLVMEEAHQMGLPVRLRVMKVNPRAFTFYQRLGFVNVGEMDTHFLMEWSA